MKTFNTLLEAAASSLALNSDFNQVVVAGSHIFKIFSIEENEFVEKANLYTAKNNNFSSSDVVWNPIEENKLATVATNGSVITWNLNKPSRSKLEDIFKDHERPVYKVNFHPFEARLLLSGSLDGLMKLYDLRMKEAVSTFTSNAENVRDVQFSPHKHNHFAAGTGTGMVQIWDMRRPDRAERQITGHRDTVFSLDWNPEERNWIATASRDCTIKVWDLKEPSDAYKTIRTVASVARVKWRPNKRNHLASIAITIGSISVWDIRRPYIPFATFNEHRNISSGIAWQGQADTFLSVGKDNYLFCHSFEDAVHPIEKANPVGMDVSPHGLISSTQPQAEAGAAPVGKLQNYKKSVIGSDTFGPESSSHSVFDLNADEVVGSSYIIESAKNYRLSGRSLSEVCEHNAAIAKTLNRPMIAHTWMMVQILYGGLSGSDSLGMQLKEETKSETSLDSEQKPIRHTSGDQHGDSTGVRGGISAEEADTETDDIDSNDLKLAHPSSTLSFSHDMLFGDVDLIHYPFDYDHLNNLDPNLNWSPPNEAFQPRRDDIYQSNSPPDEFGNHIESNTKDSGHDDIGGASSNYVLSESLVLNEVEPWSFPTMNNDHLVKDTLYYYASEGDVQMAVTLIIVLAEKVKNLIPEATLEHWFLSYIEILHRLQLWNTATMIIQNAVGLPVVQQMNQKSTSVRLFCGNCLTPIPPARLFCNKCKRAPSRCSICHGIVQGLYVWCQGCSHGGHLLHIMEWMAENPFCPAGCGHLCEYT